MSIQLVKRNNLGEPQGIWFFPTIQQAKAYADRDNGNRVQWTHLDMLDYVANTGSAQYEIRVVQRE